jgi:4-amino-4-deoxy-L-arabinose transferase-like glycosyltransferase
VTLLGWVPWAVFVVAAGVWAARRLRNRDAGSLSTFLLIWVAVIVIFFSISQSKLPGYILPAIPAGILLLVEFLSRRLASKPSLPLIALHASLSGILVFFALISSYLVAQHHVPWSAALVAPLILALIVAVAMLIALRRFGYPVLRLITLVPAVLAVGITLRLSAPVLDQTLSARAAAQALESLDPHHLPAAGFHISRESEFGLQFYRDQPLPRYELGQIPSGEHLVVASEGHEGGIVERASNRRVTLLGSFPTQKLEFFYVAAAPSPQ